MDAPLPGMGHWDDALRELRKIRDFDPTNPYLLLREARYLYETGEPDKSRQILVDYRPQAGIRVAPHFYTTDDEVEHTLREIRAILATKLQ